MIEIPNLEKFAVLLAAYEGEKWIEEQIASILNQEGVQVSVFISVDLSDDRSYEIVSEMAAKDSRVYVLPYGKRYGSAGANFFRLIQDVDLVEFDFISFADQDDIWHLDKLQRAAVQLRIRSADAYSSNVIAFWENGRTKLVHKSNPQTLYDHYFEAAGPGCTYVFTPHITKHLKSFLNKSPNLTESFPLHDWLFYCFARTNDYSWFIDDKPSLYYRQHANNAVGINHGIKSYLYRWRLMKQGWYQFQVNELLQNFPLPSISQQNMKLFVLRNFTKLRRSKRDQFFVLLLAVIGLV